MNILLRNQRKILLKEAIKNKFEGVPFFQMTELISVLGMKPVGRKDIEYLYGLVKEIAEEGKIKLVRFSVPQYSDNTDAEMTLVIPGGSKIITSLHFAELTI